MSDGLYTHRKAGRIDLPDAEILERVALNQEHAAEEVRGLVFLLRPEDLGSQATQPTPVPIFDLAPVVTLEAVTPVEPHHLPRDL
jgi:hypothetical protein